MIFNLPREAVPHIGLSGRVGEFGMVENMLIGTG